MGSAVSNINFKSRTTTVERSAISNSTSRTTTTTVERSAISNSTSRTTTTTVERSAVSNSTSRTITTKVERLFATCSITERFLREIRMLRLLSSHENIIELIDIVPPRSALKFDTLCVVYEYMPSNLKHIRLSNQYLRNSQIEYIMYQILLGVKYIHSAGVIHLNLKPENILIDDYCKIRISDFHSAHTVAEYAKKVKKHKKYPFVWDMSKNTTTTSLGLPQLERRDANRPPMRGINGCHLVPDAFLLNRDTQHLYTIDMWSVGCIFGGLLQIHHRNCTDYKPYLHHNPHQLHRSFQTFFYNALLFPNTNASGIQLLSNLLACDPQKRIDAREALRSEYFDNVRDTDAGRSHLHFCVCKRIHFVRAWMRHNTTFCPSQSYQDVYQVISQYVEWDKLKYCAEPRDQVNKNQLRALIINEIIYFNPQWKKKLMSELRLSGCHY
eukprot:105986_1